MGKQTQTEIRWNSKSEDHPETHEWILLAINRPERLDKIWQKFQEQIAPLDEIRLRMKKRIPDTDLEYRLITCTTYAGKGPNIINWNRIHQGTIKRDTQLYERKTEDRLIEYVNKYIAKKFDQNSL